MVAFRSKFKVKVTGSLSATIHVAVHKLNCWSLVQHSSRGGVEIVFLHKFGCDEEKEIDYAWHELTCGLTKNTHPRKSF